MTKWMIVSLHVYVSGGYTEHMTQTVALWIAGVIIALLLADQLWLGWDIPLVVGRQLVVLVEWMAFWR